MNFKKIKLLCLLFCCIIVSIIIYHFFYSNIDEFDIISNRIQNSKLVYSVTIDNNICAYDNITDTYFYFFDKKINNFIINSTYGKINYKVLNANEDSYEILVYNNKFYDIIMITNTHLPIINMTDFSFFKNKFQNFDKYFPYDNDLNEKLISDFMGINILGIDLDKGKNNFFSLGSLSTRGASSSFFNKKSYKLELDNEFGYDNVKKDKTWVLDAIYTDNSKIRNKLSSDMWNLINNNQSIDNDLNGKFVEIFIDNEYRGLYVLKEKVDKSVTKAYENGIILKSTFSLFYDSICELIQNGIEVTDNKLLNFEVKSYNDDTLKNFVDRIFKFYMEPISYNSINNFYYLDNYLNYKIFIALISGNDNISSNQYYSMEGLDAKVLITPWDMDLTWGLYWNLQTVLHSKYYGDRNFDYEWMNTNITDNMDLETLTALKKRYFELRKSVITMDTINSYLDSYKELLVSSGAARRDSERWYNYDIEFEIEQIREWAYNRIIFLDDYFKM